MSGLRLGAAAVSKNHDTAPQGLSVVIPTLNARAVLPAALASLPEGSEVLVADGGSTDGTAALAETSGATVVSAPPGRGAQLAAGLAAASGELIVLLHADARLAAGSLQRIQAVMTSPGAPVGGCLGQRFDASRPHLLLVEALNEMRATLGGAAFGDQVVFYDRRRLPDTEVPTQPLMEDVELSLRLHERGWFAYLGCEATVSAAKWARGRSWRRFGQVLSLVARYRWARLRSRQAAASLSHVLYREYYGRPVPQPEGLEKPS